MSGSGSRGLQAVPPLWSPDTAQPAPEQGIAAAHAFVTRCRAWAVMELARRGADGRPTHEWESYLRFTDHTLRELENGTLDRWFQPPPDAR
jgi:hypothetical protein